ncbi:outer membrane protein assembly factor BamD [Desulfomicrobium norvegicum]|nr:outer membrane protein assembly factor BamD [Desulfomicrobium norvegicum]
MAFNLVPSLPFTVSQVIVMRNYLILFSFVLLLNGCGAIDYYFLTPPEDTAQELYENARGFMQDKEYVEAIDSLTKLNDRYPFSPYATEARLMLGDSYALDAQYLEAVDAYEEFLNMHPRHESIDYVLFQIGVNKYNSHRSIDLPHTQLGEAVESFRRLVNAYPDSAYRDQALDYIVKCRKLMAEHEMFVADFYFKSGSYNAAWTRYAYIIENFSELDEIVQLAKSKAKVAYFYAQEQENDTKRHPSKLKQYFDWL